MATFRIRLRGGPCNGQAKTISQAEWDAGETTCQGAVYIWNGVTPPAGQRFVFTYRPGAPPPGSGGGAGTATAPQAHTGWNDLRRTFNHDLPAALRTIRRNQDAALRELGRKRRVGH